MRPEVDSTQAERQIEDAVERLGREPLATDVLAGAVRKTELENFYGWQTSQGLGRMLGISVSTDGDLEGEAKSLERVRQLTPESLRDAAARTFAPARRVIVWMHPGPSEAAPPGSRPAAPRPRTRRPRPAAAPAHGKGGR